MPVHQLISYFLALLVSGILHECGHAIAAVRCVHVASLNVHHHCMLAYYIRLNHRERKTVSTFGVFLMFIYPGAFVEIREDFLTNTTPPWKQLKIICAGVWHNFTLALLAFALVGALPVLLSPMYSHTNGVMVASLPEVRGSVFPSRMRSHSARARPSSAMYSLATSSSP